MGTYSIHDNNAHDPIWIHCPTYSANLPNSERNWFSRIVSQFVLANVSISSPSLPLKDFPNYNKLQKSATYGFSGKLTEHSRRFCSTITRVENVPESMRNRHRPSCSTSTSCRLPSSSSTFRNTTSCHIHSHAFNSACAYYLPYE